MKRAIDFLDPQRVVYGTGADWRSWVTRRGEILRKEQAEFGNEQAAHDPPRASKDLFNYEVETSADDTEEVGMGWNCVRSRTTEYGSGIQADIRDSAPSNREKSDASRGLFRSKNAARRRRKTRRKKAARAICESICKDDAERASGDDASPSQAWADSEDSNDTTERDLDIRSDPDGECVTRTAMS